MIFPKVELYIYGDLTPEQMDMIRPIMATTSACASPDFRDAPHFHIYMDRDTVIEAPI
jgi:hypothetical protein